MNRFLHAILCLENLSSGENRAVGGQCARGKGVNGTAQRGDGHARVRTWVRRDRHVAVRPLLLEAVHTLAADLVVHEVHLALTLLTLLARIDPTDRPRRLQIVGGFRCPTRSRRGYSRTWAQAR